MEMSALIQCARDEELGHENRSPCTIVKVGSGGGGGGYQACHDTRLCHALDFIHTLSSDFSRYE